MAFGPRPAIERSDRALTAWTAWSEPLALAGSMCAGAAFAVTFFAYEWHPLAVPAIALDLAAWLCFTYALVQQLRVAPDRAALLLRRKMLTVIVVTGPIALLLLIANTGHGIVLFLRVLRLGPLGRWFLRKGSLGWAALFGLIILLVASIGFSRIEGVSYGDALYWAAATVSIGPQSLQASRPATEVLTIVLAFLGLGFFGAVVGSLTASIMQREHDEAVEAASDDIQEAIEEAVDQAEVDNALLAAKLDELLAKVQALEGRLPPA